MSPTTNLYDALTLALERADALSGHLEDRLAALHQQDTAGTAPELYALSIIAHEVCDRHQEMFDTARALHASLTSTKTPPIVPAITRGRRGGR